MLLYYYHLTHNLKVAGSNPAPATTESALPSLGTSRLDKRVAEPDLGAQSFYAT